MLKTGHGTNDIPTIAPFTDDASSKQLGGSLENKATTNGLPTSSTVPTASPPPAKQQSY